MLSEDILLNDQFPMTIWQLSELDTPDPDIDDHCCSVFSRALGVGFLQSLKESPLLSS